MPGLTGQLPRCHPSSCAARHRQVRPRLGQCRGQPANRNFNHLDNPSQDQPESRLARSNRARYLESVRPRVRIGRCVRRGQHPRTDSQGQLYTRNQGPAHADPEYDDLEGVRARDRLHGGFDSFRERRDEWISRRLEMPCDG